MLKRFLDKSNGFLFYEKFTRNEFINKCKLFHCEIHVTLFVILWHYLGHFWHYLGNCLWHCDIIWNIFGIMTLFGTYMTLFVALLHNLSLCDIIWNICDIIRDIVTLWHFLGHCDINCDIVNLLVTFWHYLWYCDIILTCDMFCDIVALFWTLWHYLWHCDICYIVTFW